MQDSSGTNQSLEYFQEHPGKWKEMQASIMNTRTFIVPLDQD